MKKLLLSILFLLMLVSITQATTVHLFYGQGCPHCAKAENYFDGIEHITLVKHEVYFNETERDLFQQLTYAYDKEVSGVPTIFIDNDMFVGFSDNIQEEVEKKINECKTITCHNPLEKITENNAQITTVTLTAVLSAALVDAINPCAFAVLIILLTTILVSKNKKKSLLAGILFALSIYISYFLMGLGLYSAIDAAGVSHTFFIVVALLAIFIGLFNLKDYFWYGKWFIMEVPMSWRPKLKKIIRSVTSPIGAFFIGFLVSLFLLPCTSGPYIVILGLLARTTTRNHALFLLTIYNLVFILPMIIITVAVYLGHTTTEQAEKWRTGKLNKLHLIAGIILLLLGIGMIIALLLGKI